MGQRGVWQAGARRQRGVQPLEALQSESYGRAQSDTSLLWGNAYNGADSRGAHIWVGQG